MCCIIMQHYKYWTLKWDLFVLETRGSTWRSCDRLQMIRCIMGRCSLAVVLVLIRQGRIVVNVTNMWMEDEVGQWCDLAWSSIIGADCLWLWSGEHSVNWSHCSFQLWLDSENNLVNPNLTRNDRQGEKSICKSRSDVVCERTDVKTHADRPTWALSADAQSEEVGSFRNVKTNGR